MSTKKKIPRPSASDRADERLMNLTEARAGLMTAILSLEHKPVYGEIATLLRMSTLRAIDRALQEQQRA